MRLAWSHRAIADLRDIRRHSLQRWGRDVAVAYLADIRRVAERVAARPDRARPLEGAFRLARVRSHYLIVQLNETDDVLNVARALHAAMDIERHLPPA